jgi:hypothetical protein
MGEIRQEKSGFTAWTDRHAELWKFMNSCLREAVPMWLS